MTTNQAAAAGTVPVAPEARPAVALPASRPPPSPSPATHPGTQASTTSDGHDGAAPTKHAPADPATAGGS